MIDTHAHLDDPQLAGDLDAVVRRAREAGVTGIIAMGTTAESSRESVNLARRFPVVHAAVGIQPNYSADAQPGDWDQVLALAEDPAVVAIGETGLDRYWDNAPFELQQDYFTRHVELAGRADLPFVVHMRDCGADIVALLRGLGSSFRGVMHSYSGDARLAEQCLDLGLHISFSGMVTYKKNVELRDAAREIPGDRLLVETDAPYLPPHPHRNRRPNEPELLVHTVACLAELRGESVESLDEQTTRNARQLFSLPATGEIERLPTAD